MIAAKDQHGAETATHRGNLHGEHKSYHDPFWTNIICQCQSFLFALFSQIDFVPKTIVDLPINHLNIAHFSNPKSKINLTKTKILIATLRH
jgi:hypothetical protein